MSRTLIVVVAIVVVETQSGESFPDKNFFPRHIKNMVADWKKSSDRSGQLGKGGRNSSNSSLESKRDAPVRAFSEKARKGPGGESFGG